MRVIVTGAAGRLGSITVPLLLDRQLEVVALDRRPSGDLRFPIEECDLRDPSRLRDLLRGAQAVVHLAAEGYLQPASRILNNNFAATANLLQAAGEAGTKKLVFASSIQVCAPEDDYPAEVAYLPLDGNLPANPRNAYGFSKAAEELLFRQASPGGSAEVVALRFPALVHPSADPAWEHWLQPFQVEERAARIAQGFSVLSFHDAARLLLACLESRLPGFRTYLPAISLVAAEDIVRYQRRYYSGVPHRTPVEQLMSLVDISGIERDTGWRPEDLFTLRPPPAPPTPPVSRLRSAVGRLRQKLRRQG